MALRSSASSAVIVIGWGAKGSLTAEGAEERRGIVLDSVEATRCTLACAHTGRLRLSILDAARGFLDLAGHPPYAGPVPRHRPAPRGLHERKPVPSARGKGQGARGTLPRHRPGKGATHASLGPEGEGAAQTRPGGRSTSRPEEERVRTGGRAAARAE